MKDKKNIFRDKVESLKEEDIQQLKENNDLLLHFLSEDVDSKINVQLTSTPQNSEQYFRKAVDISDDQCCN